MKKQKKQPAIQLPELSLFRAQNICGKNDVNGNPNRIWAVYNGETMEYLGWIDEEYSGKNWFLGRNVKEMPSIRVSTPRPYKTGQEFINEDHISHKIQNLKNSIQASKNKIESIESKRGFWFNTYPAERHEEVIKEARGQIAWDRERLNKLLEKAEK